MTTLTPVDPGQRIDIFDVLRGFALLGILFANILFFSGYSFIPFDDLRQMPQFQLDETVYDVLDIVIAGKFRTLFCILFAAGFGLQFGRHRGNSTEFLKTYRRRLFILLAIGLVHSLVWFGDILFMYAIIGLIMIMFRNVKPANLLRWSILIMFLPILFDGVLFLFLPGANGGGSASQEALAHTVYPDMTPEAVVHAFQYGTIGEQFLLNVHHLIWKWLGYIPSGGFVIALGTFLLGYYLGSVQFFTEKVKSTSLVIAFLCVGLLATASAHLLGGDRYLLPSTPANILYKTLLTTGQIGLCLFYIVAIGRMLATAVGKRVLNYLRPVGRMALSNYLFQTIACIVIFYSVGFDLIGRTGLTHAVVIAIGVLILQTALSNMWLKRFRFGPVEWLWRSLTYRKILKMGYDAADN